MYIDKFTISIFQVTYIYKAEKQLSFTFFNTQCIMLWSTMKMTHVLEMDL